jgi:hypothetical protein
VASVSGKWWQYVSYKSRYIMSDYTASLPVMFFVTAFRPQISILSRSVDAKLPNFLIGIASLKWHNFGVRNKTFYSSWVLYLCHAALSVVPLSRCSECCTFVTLLWVLYLCHAALSVVPLSRFSECCTFVTLLWVSQCSTQYIQKRKLERAETRFPRPVNGYKISDRTYADGGN